MIPQGIYDFIKRELKITNIVTIGILAFLIYKIVKNYMHKESITNSDFKEFMEGADRLFSYDELKKATNGDCKEIAYFLQSRGVGKAVEISNFLSQYFRNHAFSRDSHWIVVSGNMIYDPVFNNEFFKKQSYKFTKEEYLKLIKQYMKNNNIHFER